MKTIFKIIFFNLLILSSLFSSTFEEDIQALDTNSFNTKEKVVEQLAQNYGDDDRLTLLLSKMVAGDLYVKKDDKTFVILEKTVDSNYFTKTLDGVALEATDKYQFSKVKTNNKLRSVIQNLLAQMNLFSKSTKKRLVSAKNILDNVSKDDEELINKALESEKDSDVIEVLTEAKNIIVANNYSGEEQLKAVVILGDFISSKSLATLKAILENEASSDELKKAATTSIASIESSRSFYSFIETAFFGLYSRFSFTTCCYWFSNHIWCYESN